MAEVIIMPKLGFNMDEGDLVCWHKRVGDKVTKGELFFEINTDKTTMPIEATADGTVLKILVEEGETVEVFTPIAVVGMPGEDPEAALAAGVATASVSGRVDDMPKEQGVRENGGAPEPGEDIEAPQAQVDIKALKLTPKARKVILDEGLDVASIAQIKGTGYEGGITAKDIKASPLARKAAQKLGVDLALVQGSGAGGKRMKADVEMAAAKAGEDASAAGQDNGAAAGAGLAVGKMDTGNLGAGLAAGKTDAGSLDAGLAASGGDKKILSATPYKGVRKIIGDKLAQSKFSAPHLYFTDMVDTTNMTAFRKSLNEVSERKITISDLLVYAAGKALAKYPQINSSLVDGNIVCYKSANVGVAVAGENGLIVPVIKNVQEKSLTKVSEENRDLVDRAKEGRLAPEEYSGGTFSISNLGMFGIDNFTAIINPPEAAILSVSSVRKKAVVVEKDGEDVIEIRPMMNIQLSVDHRLIDGLLAAKFVGYMKELLENPLKILM